MQLETTVSFDRHFMGSMKLGKAMEIAAGQAVRRMADLILRDAANVIYWTTEEPKDGPDFGRVVFRFTASVYPKEGARKEDEALNAAFLAGMEHAAMLLSATANHFDALGDFGPVQALAMRGEAERWRDLIREPLYAVKARTPPVDAT